jgi:beta-glucanase (GH16 family)
MSWLRKARGRGAFPIRALIVTALASLLFGAAPGTAAGTPSAAAGTPAGWRLVASDDFSGTGLGSVWGEYGGTYSVGANAWSADQVSVSGGTLRLKLDRKSSQGKPYVSGGVGMWGLAQTYGRYEFQAMAPTDAGIDSYITLQPPDADAEANGMLVELLAKPAVSPGAQAAYVTIAYGSGQSTTTAPGSYCGAFHDYVIEWTPTYESVSVDGRVLLKSPAATSVKRWIGFVMSNGDTLTGTPGPSDPLPAEFDIRHLRVYAYSPGAPGSASTTSSTSASTSASAGTTSRPASAASTSSKPSIASATSAHPTTPGSSSKQSAQSPSTALADQTPVATSHGSWAGPLLVTCFVIAAGLAAIAVFVRKPHNPRRHRRG